MWQALIPAGISLLGNVLSKRSARAENPYLDPLAQQAMEGRAAAQTYAQASVDPNSAWFRNLAALFREGAEADIMQGVRLAENRRLRQSARGLGDASDRADEAVSRNISRLFYRAGVDSRTQAGTALRSAAGAATGAASIPPELFSTLGKYGDVEARRQSDIYGGLGGILDTILKNRGGGGTTVVADGGVGGLSAAQGGLWW